MDKSKAPLVAPASSPVITDCESKTVIKVTKLGQIPVNAVVASITNQVEHQTKIIEIDRRFLGMFGELFCDYIGIVMEVKIPGEADHFNLAVSWI